MTSFPKLILDTNALRDNDFVYWLAANYHGDKCVPAIVYMEYKRQVLSNGLDPTKLDKLISKAGIKIVPFTKKEADVAAELMSERMEVCKTCNKIDWVDTMIYSSLGCAPTILVTNNIVDFPDSDRVHTPEFIMKAYSRAR